MRLECFFVLSMITIVIPYPYAPEGNYQVVVSRTRVGNTLVENGMAYAASKSKTGISYALDDDHAPRYVQQSPHAADNRRNNLGRRPPQFVDANGMVFPAGAYGTTLFRPGGFHYSHSSVMNHGHTNWRPNDGHVYYGFQSTPPPYSVYHHHAGSRPPPTKTESSYRPKPTTATLPPTTIGHHHSSVKPQQHQYQIYYEKEEQQKPQQQEEQHQPELKPIFTSVQNGEEVKESDKKEIPSIIEQQQQSNGEELQEDSGQPVKLDFGMKADSDSPPTESSTTLPMLHHTLDDKPILSPNEKIAIAIEYPTFNYNNADDDTTRAPLKRPTLSSLTSTATTSSTSPTTTTTMEIPDNGDDIKPR